MFRIDQALVLWKFSYERGFFDLLDSVLCSDPAWLFSDARHVSLELAHQVRQWAEMDLCESYGVVLLRGKPSGFCCHPFDERIQDHLPHPVDTSTLRPIDSNTQSRASFPRSLNRTQQSVIQNMQIHSSYGPAPNGSITGILYAINTFRQFMTPFYAVFQRCDKSLPLHLRDWEPLTTAISKNNCVMTQSLRQSIYSLQSIAMRSMLKADQCMNLAILNPDETLEVSHKTDAMKNSCRTSKILQHVMFYDQLTDPFVFWNGHRGFTSSDPKDCKRATTLIRKPWFDWFCKSGTPSFTNWARFAKSLCVPFLRGC
jgi:hypothetical protein